MYRNTRSICRGDKLSLQSDMRFFRAINSTFSGKFVREAVFFKSGSENEVETIGESEGNILRVLPNASYGTPYRKVQQ